MAAAGIIPIIIHTMHTIHGITIHGTHRITMGIIPIAMVITMVTMVEDVVMAGLVILLAKATIDLMVHPAVILRVMATVDVFTR